jgi:hypothetical protein
MRGALETLEEEDITVNFLRHALIAMRGYLREAQVYDVVQDIVKGEQGAVTFASRLEVLANAYVATFNPEHEYWNHYPEAARRAIEVFNLLNIRPMRPLLLAITAKMGEKDATAAFQMLISLGVRLLIAGTTRSGSVEVPLATMAHDVSHERIVTAKELKAKLREIAPTDQQFRHAFEIATVSNARLGRYYLRSLEMAAKGEAEPWFMPNDDRAIINLEHVLPRKPSDNWKRFSPEEVGIYAKRLGNLALLKASDNSDLRSDGFSDKREVYANSPYVLTSQIAEAAYWDASAISKRQKTLAQMAVKAWPL